MDAFGLGFGFGLYGLWELTGFLMSPSGILVILVVILAGFGVDYLTCKPHR